MVSVTNNLSHILLVMTLIGLWPKIEWSKKTKLLYLIYCRLIDVIMLLYVVAKIFNASKALNCDKIFEEVYEALYLAVLFLQRLSLITSKLVDLVNTLHEMLKTNEIKGSIARKYNRYERQLITAFAVGTIFGMVQLFFLQKPPTYCPAQDKARFDLRRRLIIELWLPYDETRSPYWEITDLFLKVLVVIAGAHVYVFSVLVPLIVLEACCHFKIVAYLLRNKVTYKREKLPGQVSLTSVIRYHQKILR